MQEPFNIEHRPGICKTNFDYWFTHAGSLNEQAYYYGLKVSVEFRYQLYDELKTIATAKDTVKMLLNYFCFTRERLLKRRPLPKDPIAIFSAKWLAEKINMDVTVHILHPAAFAASLKIRNWVHPFSHFLEQPLLTEKYLSKYKNEIEEFSKINKNVVDQAILLWKILYHVILRYQSEAYNWILLGHEDLSQKPVNAFNKILKNLNLEYSKKLEN